MTIVRHRFHTGFAFQVRDLPAHLIPEISRQKSIDAVEIGWGDRDFYMAAGDDYWLGAKAMVWPTSSVMHVVQILGTIRNEFSRSELVEIAMDKTAFLKLVTALDATFDRDENTPSKALGVGLYGDAKFYPAKGSFHLFHTCNIWVSKILAQAGCPVSESGNFHASDVVEQVLPFSIFHKSMPEK